MNVELIRAIVRPVLTVGSLGTVLYLACTGQEVPDEILTIATVMVTWWFKERSDRANGNGSPNPENP